MIGGAQPEDQPGLAGLPQQRGHLYLGCRATGVAGLDAGASGAVNVAMAAGDARRAGTWRVAILVSGLLWLAVLAGNIALYVVRPPDHWPALETIEALQSASLIPVALYLHQRNRGSRWSGPVTALGVIAMLGGAAVAIGFATGIVAFGKGAIGGTGYFAVFGLILIWLGTANLVAWRLGSLPRRIAAIGMAAALTAMLLYPLWAVGVARTVDAPGDLSRPG